MTNDKDYKALKRLYDSTNEAIRRLEVENTELGKKLIILEAEKKQWLQQKIIQDQVIARTLRNSDDVIRRLQDEIGVLRKRLKNGNIN